MSAFNHPLIHLLPQPLPHPLQRASGRTPRHPSSGRFAPGIHPPCIALAVAALVAGCGGGDGPSAPVVPVVPVVVAATVLKGVAATGAALAGATVTVIDGDAATPDPAAVTTAADGSFSVDVSALKAPFVIQASGRVDGVATRIVAIVPSVSANADNTANVTPLTHAVAALVAPGGDPLALLSPATLAASVTAQKVADASSLVVNTLKSDPVIAAVMAAAGANFNPLSTAFSANGSGLDAVLDKLSVEVSAAGVAITNLAAAIGGSGLPAAVVLTPAQTTTPTVVPTLPASTAAADLPTAADLAALGAKYQACLALPLAQRVTLDGSGTVTAVSAPCNYAPTDWKSNGRTWAQELGQFIFAKDLLSHALVGKGQVVLTLAAANLTDPKDSKHPYCNTATCVVVRWPLTTASGQASAADWLLAKVAGKWDVIGNQRPYRAFVEPRLQRYINANRDGAAAGNAADPYFFKDRFESQVRLQFDLTSPDTAKVRAVRFTGPGLPAAGVVQFRSQRCGSDDRMGISYQNGSTRVNTNNALQFWTGSATTDFVLDAANLDGTPLALPTPVLNATTASNQNFSPLPVANPAAVAPAWSVYKAEVFYYASASDEPDEIIWMRSGAAPENASAGAGKTWPTLAASFVDAYLKPSGAQAGAISSLAQTMGWTLAAGSYVGSGYLFSQNFATATNSQGESASYGLRTRLDFEPKALGDLSGSGWQFASVVAGTSLSPSTATSGTNPNPRCTSTDLVPLTASISDYREAGLLFRGADRKLYNAVWFWDN